MFRWKAAGVAAAAAFIAAGSVAAAEQTLEFRLVTKRLGGSSMEVANVEGRSVGAGEYAGVAVFDDGRIAYKNFVEVSDGTDEEGSYSGYSTYTFQNGDSLTLKFTGGWGLEGDAGDYEILSGTGAFAEATGTGHFEAADEPWDGVNLYDGSFTITLPGS
jgi:hypothetical protein